MQKRKVLGFIILLAALGAALAAYFAPSPSGVEESTYLYSSFGPSLTLADAVVAMGGTLLFIIALRNFKKELRPAYSYIALSQLALTIGALVYAYVEYFNLWESTLLTIATYANYFFGSVLMFFGIRKFSRILGLRSKLTSILLIAAAVLALWGLRAFIPHSDIWGPLGFSELQYDLFEIVSVLPVICYGAALFMTARIRRKIGHEYNKAFTALTVGIGLLLLSSLNVFVLELVGYENDYALSRLYLIPTLIGDLGILYAALQLSMIGLPYEKGIWQRVTGGKQQPATSINIITYAASLCSDPSKIDPYLDKVRSITASGTSQTSLSENDQLALRDVYLNIEHSLATDPLRHYSPEELRENIHRRFFADAGESSGTATFWPLLKQASSN